MEFDVFNILKLMEQNLKIDANQYSLKYRWLEIIYLVIYDEKTYLSLYVFKIIPFRNTVRLG